MTSIDFTRNPINGGLIRRAVAFISDWNDLRVTRKALSRLSDRELEDIGLTRGDVYELTKRG